jgi:hypothetical protein
MSLKSTYDRDAARILATPLPEPSPITAADIEHLPAPVQRYLRFTGVIGAPRVHTYRLVLGGEFKNGADRPWMPITAHQVSAVDPIARLFFMKGRMFGLPVAALHRYVGPHATFRVRVAGLFNVVDAKGPKMDQGETVTVLNDMCLLAPGTLIDPRLRWEEHGGDVTVSFENAGHTVSARLSFGKSGAITDFVSHDRFATEDGTTYEQLPWSTPIYEWGDVGGIMLPTRGEAAWLTDDGPEPYARLKVIEAEFNPQG